jgi:23S rRNA (pseudouridine1915-N3)-methyltransferase
MRIAVIAASNRQPGWVAQGFDDYAKRLRGSCTLTFREVALARRTVSTPIERSLEIEGERMLAAVPKRARVVALDETGEPWSTAQLAARLRAWLALGAPVALLIGGPDGLAPSCRRRADEQWSLSPLTLPHGLVRVTVAEAIYRAWTLLEGHPYHRA